MNSKITYPFCSIVAWSRWLLVTVLLVAKCYLFDTLVASPEALNWSPASILSKIAAAIFLTLPICISAKRWPIFALLGMTDIWMIIQLIYFRANHLFITWHMLTVAGNMEGFWSSLIPYCDASLLLFPALTCLAALCYLWQSKRHNKWEILIICILGFGLSLTGSIVRWYNHREYLNGEPLSWEWMNPCSLPQAFSVDISEKERMATNYIRYRSIYAYPLFMANDAIRTAINHRTPEDLSEEEMEELKKLINPILPATIPQGNLVILLLESFESWLLDASDSNGSPICPEMKAYIDHHPILYVKDVTTQIQYGMSGDGQMIVNTGMYPLSEGIACVDYGDNTYPNIAHFYPQSAIVNPCRNVWNQTMVATSYGYKQLVEPQSEYRFEWNDSVVIDKMIEIIYTLSAPSCVMGITVSGHIPFDSSPDDIALPDTIPALFRHYMQTAHFTDRQIGRLLAWADTAQIMQNSVIAITGDHRIFHAWLNDEVRDYGLRTNLPFGTGQAGCPLIIKAPQIDSAIVIENGRQIDIFSTILALIGQENYFWKGMGCNLLQDSLSDEENYYVRRQLSDKLIRLNYFKQ